MTPQSKPFKCTKCLFYLCFFPFCRSTAFLIAKTALFSVQRFFVDRLKAFKIGIFCSSNGFKWQIVKVLSAKNPLSFHKVKASNNYVHQLFPQNIFIISTVEKRMCKFCWRISQSLLRQIFLQKFAVQCFASRVCNLIFADKTLLQQITSYDESGKFF